MSEFYVEAVAVEFARQIRQAESDIEAAAIEDAARGLCDVMQRFDSAFDRKQFLAACEAGSPPEETKC